MSDGRKQGISRGLTSYGDERFSLFLRKAFLYSMGYTDDALSRPIVGIADTYSGYNPCHRTVPELVEAVKRGVMLAGALPVPFSTISLHESFAHPTSMFLRNLMSIDTEEMIRGQPMDAVVLIGGCDKTVPAQLMGAASANIPAIQVVTGPMLTGSHRGERVGACTDCRRFWANYRAGEIDDAEIAAVNSELVPTAGTCSVMGTASTMASIAEALGMMLPGSAAIPAVSAARLKSAEEAGTAAVRLAEQNVKPSDIMTPRAFENALRILLAIGGSTNGIVHLTAIAGRLGIKIDLEGVDAMSRETPVLVDLKPTGKHYMEDLHKAGGLGRVLAELRPLLHLDCLTVSGQTLGEILDGASSPWTQDVVSPVSDPIYAEGGIALLRGNLAPDGAIIKQSAASQKLMRHEGRAVVFDGLEDLANRIDADDLDVTADDVLVLKNIGPKGAPGMPEAGYIPIPKKLARQGIKDMVRISDGRMSGTAAGSIILHVTPEAAVGGPLALVETGDRIRLDVEGRDLSLLVPEAELEARRRRWQPPAPHGEDARGYRRLFLDSVLQADGGCDFTFLTPPAETTVPAVRAEEALPKASRA